MPWYTALFNSVGEKSRLERAAMKKGHRLQRKTSDTASFVLDRDSAGCDPSVEITLEPLDRLPVDPSGDDQTA